MGTGKKEKARREREGKSSDMVNVKVKGENFYRSAKKTKLLKMRTEGKPQRDSSGKITKEAAYQSRDVPQARVAPNRKWFGNTRVISQDSLSAFRTAMAERAKDPYQVLLKSNKLPMSLIRDGETGKNGIKEHAAKIRVESEPFKDVFGPQSQRKRVKMSVGSLRDLAAETGKMQESYEERIEQARVERGAKGENGEEEGVLAEAKEPVFSKGQSKRLWNELYKVIDSSDVLLMVLDARDPTGTRCEHIEKYLRTEAPHKHLIFVLNKVDLVPQSVAASWARTLSKEYPTLAFHASLKNPFGKGAMINLLRQIQSLHKDRHQISAGLIGYPSVGKSSVINTLRSKAVCKTSSNPGETKIWQYVTLTKKIYLIDCPGVVPPSATDTEEDLLLRGVVRVENIANPAQYIDAVLQRVKRKYVERTYNVTGWESGDGFLELLARKAGRLLKGGEPDLDGVAKMVLNDWLRGRLPWFVPPPKAEEKGDGEGADGKSAGEEKAGESGELKGGKGNAGIGREKRKRDEGDVGGGDGGGGKTAEEEDEDEDFGGFNDEEGNELAIDDDDES